MGQTIHLIQAAFQAGAAGLDDASRVAGGGRHIQNARRDLIVQFLKGTTFPDVYWTDIPLWNPDTQVLELEPFPFLLPHELFARFVSVAGFEKSRYHLPTHIWRNRDCSTRA